jgi:hypothetical protein
MNSETSALPTNNRQCPGSNKDGAPVFQYLLDMPIPKKKKKKKKKVQEF